MADTCRDWLNDQTTDCSCVVIGRPSHPTILCSAPKKITVELVGPPSLLVTEYLLTSVATTDAYKYSSEYCTGHGC